MKTLRWYGIQDVRAEELSKPVPKAGEALVRVLYAGICGSDLHIYNKGMFIRNVPETMGHEFCGIVESVPEGFPGLKPGTPVIADPMVPCGTCESCRRGSFNTCADLGFIGEVRPGCFAEYIALPAEKLIPVPEGADMRSMALAEPLAVALNVCRRAALSPEDSLAVIGGGPIGLLTAALACQVFGLKEVTVVNRTEPRRRVAEALGAEAVPALPPDRKYDKAVEAAGNGAALMTALNAVKAGGTVLAVSVYEEPVEADLNLLVGGQVTLRGCNCYGRAELADAVRLIASGKADLAPVITHVLPLDRGGDGFRLLSAPEKEAAKILLKP